VFEQVLILIFSAPQPSNSQDDKDIENINNELSSWARQNTTIDDLHITYVNLLDSTQVTQTHSLFDSWNMVELTIAIPAIVKVPRHSSTISFTINYEDCGDPVTVDISPFKPDAFQPQSWINWGALLTSFICLVQFVLVGFLALLYGSLLAFCNNWKGMREKIVERWHVPGISSPEPTTPSAEEL
jgi:hypothetical protein